MPLMFLKMAIMQFLPFIITGVVLYIAAVVGLFFAFEGWNTFFSIVAMTILAIYASYRYIKYKIKQQVQSLMGGAINPEMMKMMMGGFSAETPKSKSKDSSVVDVSDVTVKGDLSGAAIMTAGAAALGASQLLPVDNELLQEIKISPEDNLSLDMIHLEEMGDFNKFFENMSPEQMKQMEEMANQMMQMFGGSGAEGSANLLNLFAEEEVQESTEDKKS